MDFHKLKINGKLAGLGTEVFIDEMPLKGVRSIKYEVGMDRVSVAKIELDILAAGEIESDAVVKFCSMEQSIEELILNRETDDLLRFSERITEELDKRWKDANNRFDN